MSFKLYKVNKMNYFSNTYLGARKKFKKYSSKPGIYYDKIKLDGVEGADEEDLYIEIAYIGSPDPTNVLIHSSGIHGIDGFAGSAIQCSILDKHLPGDIPNETAIVFIHCLNPYGMSHLRLFNENGVDLNRNYDSHKLVEKKVVDDAYTDLRDVLNPPEEPFWWDFKFYVAIMEALFVDGYSEDRLRYGIYTGQNTNSKDLFYIGKETQQSYTKILSWLKENFPSVKNIAHLDVQTGFGSYGTDTIFPLSSDDPDSVNLFKVFNDKLKSNDSNDFSSYEKGGTFKQAVRENWEWSIYNGITQNFGTYADDHKLKSLIQENYFHNKNKNFSIEHFSKQNLLRTFYPPSNLWKSRVLENGVEAFEKCFTSFASEII